MVSDSDALAMHCRPGQTRVWAFHFGWDVVTRCTTRPTPSKYQSFCMMTSHKTRQSCPGGTSRENRANFLLFRIIYFTSEGDRTTANNIRKALSYKKERRQGKKLKVSLKRSLISFLTSKMHNQRLHTPFWEWAFMRNLLNRMRGEKPHPSQCSRPNRALKIIYSF